MSTRTAKLAVILFTTCCCTSAGAAMYRWVDENGVTVYSQTPPPTGDSVKLNKQPAPRAKDVEAANKRLQQQREQTFDEGEARTEATTDQTKNGDTQAKRARSCETARENLETLQNLGRRMIRAPDGQLVRPSEEQVQIKIEKAQIQIDEYCD